MTEQIQQSNALSLKTEIDLVVTWVNGLDVNWQREYRDYLRSEDTHIGKEYFSRRFDPKHDIQILFRSVARFAPSFFRNTWITHHPGQLPPISGPGINLVPHDAFIPQQFLPTYNPFVIESYLHRIPGLAEKFVYFNDDMYFAEHPKETDFFKNGMPIVYLETPTRPLVEEEKSTRLWQYTLARTNRLLNSFYSPVSGDPECMYRKRAAHLPRAFTKSMFQKTWEHFGPQLEAQAAHRCRVVATRRDTAIETTTMLVPWVGLENGIAIGGRVPYNLLRYRPDEKTDAHYTEGSELFPSPSHYEAVRQPEQAQS